MQQIPNSLMLPHIFIHVESPLSPLLLNQPVIEKDYLRLIIILSLLTRYWVLLDFLVLFELLQLVLDHTI
jgi:hypothetical protein